MKSILKKTLKNMNISVTKLANNTGISRSLLSQLVNSDKVPAKTRMDVIQKIMAYLQCDIFKIIHLEITNLQIIFKMDLNHYQAPKDVYQDKNGASIVEEYGRIEDTSFAIVSLELEGVKLQFPLSIITINSPRSYSESNKKKKRIFDERLLMADVSLIRDIDIKILKKDFSAAYNAIPEKYNEKSAYENILKYPFLSKVISYLLLDEKIIKFDKYDADLFPQINLTWGSHTYANEVDFDVAKNDDGSYTMSTNISPQYTQTVFSRIHENNS